MDKKASFRVIWHKFITGPVKVVTVVPVLEKSTTSCIFKKLLHSNWNWWSWNFVSLEIFRCLVTKTTFREDVFRLSALSSWYFSQKPVGIKYDETSTTFGWNHPATTKVIEEKDSIHVVYAWLHRQCDCIDFVSQKH